MTPSRVSNGQMITSSDGGVDHLSFRISRSEFPVSGILDEGYIRRACVDRVNLLPFVENTKSGRSTIAIYAWVYG